MNTPLYLLVLFDLMVLFALHLFLRRCVHYDRRVLLPTMVALSGFGFHAVIFFHGAAFGIQFAMVAAMLGLLTFHAKSGAVERDPSVRQK